MKKIFVLMIAAAMAFTACNKDPKPTPTPTPTPDDEKEYVAPITIDGNYADWAKLDASKIVSASCDPAAAKQVLKLAKVYADEVAVYIYIEYDATKISWSNVEGSEEWVPFHLYFDADNSLTTGGAIGDQWSETGIEVLFEGFLTDGNQIVSYDPGAYPWNGEVGANAWAWDVENPLAEGGICNGAGGNGKYEISFLRDMFPNGDGLADPFKMGIDIQQGWSTVGYLPNASAEDDKGPAFLITANK